MKFVMQMKTLISMSVLLQLVSWVMVDAYVGFQGRTALLSTPAAGGSKKNLFFSTSNGFVVLPRKTIVLSMTEQSEEPKRRRKRKIPTEGESADESSTTTTSPSISTQQAPPVVAVNTIKLTPRDDTPVQMDIMDVRDVMGGRAVLSKPLDRDVSSSSVDAATKRKDPGSPAMSATFSSSSSSSLSSSSRKLDDSLQQLLEDAKMMMEDGESSSGGSSESEGTSMKASIRNALGTLVTADFFVVCVFLLWFLLGIFCSSVLKDDTVQIAFNSNFQAYVQPALGVLMIGSVAGSFFKDEDEEDY